VNSVASSRVMPAITSACLPIDLYLIVSLNSINKGDTSHSSDEQGCAIYRNGLVADHSLALPSET